MNPQRATSVFTRRVFILLFLILPSPLAAQEPILFARSPDISPDGKTVAFSYQGDIWTVDTIGGAAHQVTMHEAHDIYPVFSPDGRYIAFSSNRFGSYDVFYVPVAGGKPHRLTYDSASELVLGWSRDGRSIQFLSNRSTAYPAAVEAYSISIDGGTEVKLPFNEAKEIAYSSKDSVAFVRGPGIWYRKGYRGSSNDDIWLANADGSKVRRLSEFSGQDSAPMWSPEADRLYYVSELLGGPANIVCQEMDTSQHPPAPKGSPRSITKNKGEAVRRARISANGEWIVYESGPDLWVVDTRGGEPRKLAIEIHADDKANPDRTVTYTRDISEYAPSPDDSHIAFIVHGEIFLMPTRGGKATRLTDTRFIEHGISWSPDGKKILYIGDQDGQEDIYLLESDDPESSDITKAQRFKSTRLTNTREAESSAAYLPSGDRILFMRSGKLLSMKPDGSDVKTLVDQTRVFDYDSSPDGKWIVYARSDGSFASELYIIPSDGSKPPVNVTRYATFNGEVSWNNSAHKISFISQRKGTFSVHILPLQKPLTSEAKNSDEIDWDDIHLRAESVAPFAAEEATMSRNGAFVAFHSTGNGDDLWVVKTDGTNLNRVTLGNTRPRQIRWSRNSSGIYFLDAFGALRTVSFGGFSIGSTTPNIINFTAKLTIRRDEEFAQMFDQAWRALEENFYDSSHHGVDWLAVRAKYRPLLSHITMKEDLYALISLMLGELNASHLGVAGPIHNPDEVTADLGLIFDEKYTGQGLKIAEVIKRGPADKRGIDLKAGDVILAIDRVDLTPKLNLSELLNGKVGEAVRLDVAANPADPKGGRRKIELQGSSRDVVGKLMYQRWVDANAALVSKESGGKIGYIHIPSMDEAGVEQFVRSLYSDNFGKDGIVLDVRYNGGGFTHEQILNYLGAKEHTLFRQRDGGEGLVMRSYDRKWTKPVTLLINNRSYSDAEIFPSAFRTLGLGKIVGQTTGGFVIGTSEIRLIDGSRFRLPRTGVYTVKGVNMEKEGVVPDIAVDASPEDLARGVDPQLNKAVEVAMKEVVVWQKARTPGSPNTGGSGTPTPVTMPK